MCVNIKYCTNIKSVVCRKMKPQSETHTKRANNLKSLHSNSAQSGHKTTINPPQVNFHLNKWWRGFLLNLNRFPRTKSGKGLWFYQCLDNLSHIFAPITTSKTIYLSSKLSSVMKILFFTLRVWFVYKTAPNALINLFSKEV